MHASCSKSSFECERLYTVEKDKLRTLRSNFNLVFLEFKAIFADYLGVESSASDESQVIEKLKRELAILDSKSDQPLQQEDVRVLLDSLKLFMNISMPLYRAASPLEQTFKDLSTLSEELLDKVLLLQKELNSCKEEIQSLKENYQSLYEDFSDLSYGIHCSEDRNRTTKEEKRTMEMRVTSLEDEKRTMEMLCTSLEDQKRTMEMLCTSVEDQKRTMEMQFTSLKHQRDTTEERLHELESKIQYLISKENKYIKKAKTLKCRDYIREATNGLLKKFKEENRQEEESIKWSNLSNELMDKECEIYRLLKVFLQDYDLKVSNFYSLMKERLLLNSKVHKTLPIKRARELRDGDTSFKYISHETFQKCIKAYEKLLKDNFVRKIDEKN